MTVTAKNLANSQYAATSATIIYTTPAATKTIIDKFTATNSTVSAATLTVYIVPSGSTAGVSNAVLSAFSIAANTCLDLTQIQNQILNTGDFVSALSGTGSAIVIRMSGREIT